MESFYGGKRGFSFIFQENKRENSDGLWTDVGAATDANNIDTLYSGIKRGDINPGEYAAIYKNGENYIYRVDFTGVPILITTIPCAQDGNGGAVKNVYLYSEIGVQTPSPITSDIKIATNVYCTDNSTQVLNRDIITQRVCQPVGIYAKCYDFTLGATNLTNTSTCFDSSNPGFNDIHAYLDGESIPLLAIPQGVIAFIGDEDPTAPKVQLPTGIYLVLDGKLLYVGYSISHNANFGMWIEWNTGSVSYPTTDNVLLYFHGIVRRDATSLLVTTDNYCSMSNTNIKTSYGAPYVYDKAEIKTVASAFNVNSVWEFINKTLKNQNTIVTLRGNT